MLFYLSTCLHFYANWTIFQATAAGDLGLVVSDQDGHFGPAAGTQLRPPQQLKMMGMASGHPCIRTFGVVEYWELLWTVSIFFYYAYLFVVLVLFQVNCTGKTTMRNTNNNGNEMRDATWGHKATSGWPTCDFRISFYLCLFWINQNIWSLQGELQKKIHPHEMKEKLGFHEVERNWDRNV